MFTNIKGGGKKKEKGKGKYAWFREDSYVFPNLIKLKFLPTH